MIVYIIAIIAFALLYFTHKNNFNYWKRRNVPFIKPIPIFGNIFPLIIGKFQASFFFQQLYRSTNEPYVGLYVFHRPFILIRDLDLIKHVLLKDADYFFNRTLKTSKYDRIGQNLIVLRNDESCKIAKKSVSPIFTPNKLKRMLPLINQVGDDLIRHIENTEDKFNNCLSIGVKYAVDVVTTCFFGLQIKSLEEEDSEFLRVTLKFFEVTFSRGLQIVSCFFAPQIIDFFNMTFVDTSSMDYMEQVFLKMLKDRKLNPIKRNDFIDILNELTKNDSDYKFDDENLASLAVTFLVAGYETTASVLSYVWYELGCNKDIQVRLRNEVQEALHNYEEFSYEALAKMDYLEMVINETLRKYPLIGFLDRLCLKDYKVPNTNLVIEKGTGIYISARALHFDPQYFPNPEKFDPERFSISNKNLFPEFAFMPFGKGFRACIGARFATLALKVAVAKTVMNFQIDLCKDTPRPILFDPRGVMLTPENGKLHLTFNPI